MHTEIKPFSEWGDIFIVQDYIGEFGYDKETAKNLKLGGAIVFKGDSLNELTKFVSSLIENKVEAVMIELYHLHGSIFENDIVTYLIPLLESNGYKNLESYEHRLAFGKDFLSKGFC